MELVEDGVDKFAHQPYVVVEPFHRQTKAVNFSGSLSRRTSEFLETLFQARVIDSNGFVQSFSSAEDFLNSPCVHESACLILDVQMPGTSGPELQTRIIDMGLEIPVIFVTANAEERNRILEAERRAVDVLLKPFGEEALLRAVKTALAL